MVATARGGWRLNCSPARRPGLRRRSRLHPVPPVRGHGRTGTAEASERPRRLRQANLLACGIGLPAEPIDGDVNGLRIGTPEIVRLGMTEADMPALASFIARGLDPSVDPETVAPEVTEWRRRFSGVHFIADQPA